MIFKISEKPFFRDNPESRAVPEFIAVGDEPMKYICLVYGYNSPLRKMNLNDKKLMALSISGFKKTPKGRRSKMETDLLELRTDEVKKAIEVYKKIQFDDDRDTLDAYDEQLQEFKELMRKKDKSDRQLDQALKVSEKMPTFLRVRKEIQDILQFRNEEEFSAVLDDEIDFDYDSKVELFLEKSLV